MLAASVVGVELQRIAPLIVVPFDNVKVPPLMLPVKVIVCTALVLEVPAVVVATLMVAAAPLLTVRLLTADIVGRTPVFWKVTVAVAPLTVTVTGSSLPLTVPVLELVPTLTLVMVPAPPMPIEPPLLVHENPDNDPPVTVPPLVATVMLLMAPEPGVLSSWLATVPVLALVPTLTLVIVP